MTGFAPLGLAGLLNARAATSDLCRHAGRANPWGNSFPAEDLPFGTVIELGGTPFSMPVPDGESNDHLELRGQRIGLSGEPVAGIAALGYAEMGERPWHILLEGDGSARRIDFVAPSWLQDRRERSGDPHLAAPHIHYPGGYELDFFLPTAWPMVALFAPLRATSMTFSTSPLVHLFAITLIQGRRS